MASPLDESVKYFVEDVFGNETLTDDERKQFVLSAMLSLENKITDGKHRWGMSMMLADLGKDARQLRKKSRIKIESFDVNDVGC